MDPFLASLLTLMGAAPMVALLARNRVDIARMDRRAAARDAEAAAEYEAFRAAREGVTT